MQLPLKHILLLVLGLNLMKNNVGIFAHYGCRCTGQTRVTNSGSIIGECLTRYYGSIIFLRGQNFGLFDPFLLLCRYNFNL